MSLKLEFKIGAIEFRAEGEPHEVDKQRECFVNTIFPLAVDAMTRNSCSIVSNKQYLEIVDGQVDALPETVLENGTSSQIIPSSSVDNIDFSRESLNTFINKYGDINDQDFLILSAYFSELKYKNTQTITSDIVKQFYEEARRKKPSNISENLSKLVKKGFIKDDESAEKKFPKPYILTNKGLNYAKEFTPRDNVNSKIKKTTTKKSVSKSFSEYSTLNIDELKLNEYPSIESFTKFKDQMMLVLYIVNCANLGESFTAEDVLCIMKDKLGISVTIAQINGVFSRNKTWFASSKSDVDGKFIKRKLLNGAKNYAKSLIESTKDGN